MMIGTKALYKDCLKLFNYIQYTACKNTAAVPYSGRGGGFMTKTLWLADFTSAVALGYCAFTAVTGVVIFGLYLLYGAAVGQVELLCRSVKNVCNGSRIFLGNTA